VTRAAAAPVYRLEELGWLQFQQLCDAVGELVGVPAAAWTGTADMLRTAAVDHHVALPDALGGGTLEGPVTLLGLFGYRRPSHGCAVRIRDELRPSGRVLLLTNMDADEVRGRIGRDGGRVAVLDGRELGRLLDAAPDLRLRLPSVLGVRDLAPLIEAEAAERSAFDIAAAMALARVFVPTAAYASASTCLRRHGFAVLLGPPEMGKTAIAHMVGLAQLTRGWEAHECIRPEQVLEAYRRDRPQVFVADDAFGSTEYRPDAADRWALDLDRILRAMDEQHWLLWTSRPAPLHAGLRRVRREHGVERFPQPAEVLVDAADLSDEEKALILFRHARAADLPAGTRIWLRRRGWRIVGDPHFTPERIRRFAAERLPALDMGTRRHPEAVTAEVAAELHEPTDAMATSLDTLAPEHRALLVAMLDVPPGPVAPRELAAAARRHSPAGLARPAGELLDRLTDHFLAILEDGDVSWVHPSWRDLVIDRVAADAEARRRFVEVCSLEGALLALSIAGGAAGERRLPFLRADADWDAVAGTLERLVPDLDEPSLQRLLAALREALWDEPDADVADELRFLAARVLERSRPAVEGLPPALGLIEAWLALAAGVDEVVAAPDLSRVWVELLPGRLDGASRGDAARLDDWTRLLEILTQTRPPLLERLGAAEAAERRIVSVLAQLELIVEREAPVSGAWDLYAQAVRRIGRLDPDRWSRTRGLALELRTEPHEPVWTTLPPEPGQLGAGVEAPTVERILRDLTPPGRGAFFRR
jgi:hypothetical protein